jgi:hypothetical protein
MKGRVTHVALLMTVLVIKTSTGPQVIILFHSVMNAFSNILNTFFAVKPLSQSHAEADHFQVKSRLNKKCKRSRLDEEMLQLK